MKKWWKMIEDAAQLQPSAGHVIRRRSRKISTILDVSAVLLSLQKKNVSGPKIQGTASQSEPTFEISKKNF